jgi:hypothetical protein
MNYGASRPARPGTPITLPDGHHLTDVAMRLPRGAVISGTVTDDEGQPVFGVVVRAMRLTMQQGVRAFSPSPYIDTTDDRGQYRLFGLLPGEYAIVAQPRLTAGEVRAMTDEEIRAVMNALEQRRVQAQVQAQQAQAFSGVAGGPPMQAGQKPAPNADAYPSDDNAVTVAYAQVLYPGVTSPAQASTVTVAAGEERSGIGFPLRLVRTARIEGTVSTPTGIPPQRVQLMLTPADGASMPGLSLTSMRTTPAPDGTFSFTGVQPGQYTINAQASEGQAGGRGGGREGAPATMMFQAQAAAGGAPEPMVIVGGPSGGSAFWGQAEVSVDGSPVRGVALTLQPGMTITGKIEFRSSRISPPADLTRVRLNVMPAPAPGATRIMMGAPSVQVGADGRFVISGVVPGQYRITGQAPLAPGSTPGVNWTMASVVANGRDALDDTFDVAPGQGIGDVLITFVDVTQEVGGTLQDATGRPAPAYTIVVVPAEEALWASPRRIRAVRPGTDGRFTVPNLPVGSYRLAAVTDIEQGEERSTAFLEQLVPASVPFTLAIGQRHTQDLRIAGGL